MTRATGLRAPPALVPTLAHVRRWEDERTLTGHTNDLLFCWPNGTHIDPDSVTDWSQGHVRATGLPVIRLHDVRHSHATAPQRR